VWGERALPDIMISDGKQRTSEGTKKKSVAEVNRCGIYMSVDPPHENIFRPYLRAILRIKMAEPPQSRRALDVSVVYYRT